MSKQDYIAEYNKKSYYSFLVRIPNRNEEVVEKLDSVSSRNGYIMNLIEEDVHPSVLRLSFIKKTLKEILGKHNISRIFLFGSYARGEATKDSDVDILCDKGDIQTLLEKGALEDELEERLGRKADLVFLSAQMPDSFRNAIEEDMIQLC